MEKYEDYIDCEECKNFDNGQAQKTFVEHILEASQTIEERLKVVELDIKRLKRELGLK